MILCRDCKHCKTVPVGYVSSRSWCKILPKKIRGVQPWREEVHPKCPLKENKAESEDKGVLEQLAEKQNNLSATNKAWSDVIKKDGYVN